MCFTNRNSPRRRTGSERRVFMLALSVGILGFVCLLIYDVNSFTLRRKVLHAFFALGTGLVAAATLADLSAAVRLGAFSGAGDAVLAGVGVLWLGALVYSLFFALPFTGTYCAQPQMPRVCDRGVYALCRHPGVLCFLGMYVFLGAAALPSPLLAHGMVYSFLNFCYVIFQDLVTFPKTFCDYAAYRKRVPFLIPTRRSLGMALQTWRQPTDEEGQT